MANIITGSYAVFTESLSILRKNKRMAIFPVLCGIVCVIVLLGFVAFLVLAIDVVGLFSIAAAFLLYLAIYCICIFFSSALVAYASVRLTGGTPSVLDGLRIAGKRIRVILLWGVFSATVGIIIELIDKMLGEKFDFVATLVGAAWSLGTFFVIPVMIFENKTPRDALRGSVGLFKKRWGEAITGIAGIGLSVFLLGVAGLLLLVGAMQILPDAGIIVALFLFVAFSIFLVLLYNVLNGIYVASLYHFATTGEVRGGYSESTIRNAGVTGCAR